MGRYMVFNIGCLECGVSSNVVGFYDSKEEAEVIADFLSETLNWREGGQNDFKVFDIEAPQHEDYSTALMSMP